MTDTNFIGSIVKILEPPSQKTIKNNIPILTFRVQFPQVKGNSIVNLKFWGNIGKDIANYYKTNDYILIEGYLNLDDLKSFDSLPQRKRKIEITVLKIYPFVLSSPQFKTGIFDE